MYHIEKNSAQEVLIIPLFARLICSEHYPELFSDPTAARICAMPDYTMSEAGGVSEFVREYTLASGGPYCDCGYKKKK